MKKFQLYWLTNFEYYRDKEVLLLQLEDNKYYVREFGKFKPILNAAGAILVENQLAAIFQKYAADQIESVQNVTIHRRATDETWANYVSIVFKHDLEVQKFENADSDGVKIYTFMNNEIYVTSALKNKIELEYKDLKEIEFINEIPLVAG